MSDEGLKHVQVKVAFDNVMQLTGLCHVLFDSPAEAVVALAYTIANVSVGQGKPEHRAGAKAECLRILSDAYDYVDSIGETRN